MGFEEKDIRVNAAGALLKYLRDTQMNALSHITQISFHQGLEVMLLDRATRRNLELTETLRAGERRGSLLWLLDQTKTAMGARLMKTWVEEPLVNRERIEIRLNARGSVQGRDRDHGRACRSAGSKFRIWNAVVQAELPKLQRAGLPGADAFA